jgi:hypothetical protein
MTAARQRGGGLLPSGPIEPAPREGSTVLGMGQELLTVGLMARRSGLTVTAHATPAGSWTCQENGIGDWDLAFAYEPLARAHAVAGETAQARHYTEQALAAARDIAEDGERELVLAALETIPGQPRYW